MYQKKIIELSLLERRKTFYTKKKIPKSICVCISKMPKMYIIYLQNMLTKCM